MNHQEAIKQLMGVTGFSAQLEGSYTQFSQLEFHLKVTIANAIEIKSEHVAQVLTHDFSLLCTIVENVVIPSLSKEQGAKLKDLLKTCYEMNADRVRIATGSGLSPKILANCTMGQKGKLDPIAHFNNAASIASEADLASRLNRQLSANLRNKL